MLEVFETINAVYVTVFFPEYNHEIYLPNF